MFISNYLFLSKFCFLIWLSNLDWFKVLPILTPYVILLSIPLIKAHNENVRVEKLRTGIVGWIHRIVSGIKYQEAEIKKMLLFLDNKPVENSSWTEIPVEHLLEYPDQDLRKIFYEKLSKKKIKKDENGLKFDSNVNHYLNIVADLYMLKNSYTWLKEHTDNLNDENQKLIEVRNEKNKEGIKLIENCLNITNPEFMEVRNTLDALFHERRNEGDKLPVDYTIQEFYDWIVRFRNILTQDNNHNRNIILEIQPFMELNAFYHRYLALLQKKTYLFSEYKKPFQKQLTFRLGSVSISGHCRIIL